MLASHVVCSHIRSHPEANPEEKTKKPKTNNTSHLTPISQDMLKKYIVYARQRVFPKMTDVDSEKLASFYSDALRCNQPGPGGGGWMWGFKQKMELRAEAFRTGGAPMTARHMDSLIRLAEANARIELRHHVNSRDIDNAIAVMLESFIQSQKHQVAEELRKKFRRYLAQGPLADQFMAILDRLFKEASIKAQLASKDVELEEIPVEMTEVIREIEQAELKMQDATAFMQSTRFLQHFRVEGEKLYRVIRERCTACGGDPFLAEKKGPKKTSEEHFSQAKRLLPFPEVEHLPELARALTFVLPTQKEALANECLDERFIAALRQAFHTAEDSHNPQDLMLLWRIARGVFMLANHALTRRYLRHDMFEDTMGMLEFDEGLPEDRRICHRQVLKVAVRFKQVLSFQDAELLERIHLNYRLQYLKDYALARVLDDAALASLFGDLDIDMQSLLFFQDACRLAKTMPPSERKLLYEKMMQHQLFSVLQQFLTEDIRDRSVWGQPASTGRKPAGTGWQPAGNRPATGRQPAGNRPTSQRPATGRQPAGNRPATGRQPANQRPANGRQPFGNRPANGRPPAGNLSATDAGHPP
eukprot:s551_g27.t2